MKSAAIRKKFLEFFANQQHEIVPSSSVVPGNDPTLLFTNAGMVQFKDVFLGQDERPYRRATSAQRCIRAGGKHNDLENVGYTARHHTFFEMLGNFSFGDYFKHDAIKFAWTFLTDVLKLPKEKLWVTVYQDDDEAADIWINDIGMPNDRVSRLGEKSNFWSMGATGPCGPCTEIFYDHGAEIAGGPPGSPDEDGDRYIEIWNLVFMQFNRAKDGSMTRLPKPSVDTGMGLERLAAILQGVHENYETDIFVTLLTAIAKLTHSKNLQQTSARVIADHIRSCSFLIADGVIPSNDGRGYVLRRIIRRAIRHGSKLGLTEPFFYKLVAVLVQEMGEAYPELIQAQPQIEKLLQQEEIQFAKTLDQGLRILEDEIAKLSDNIIPGEIVFKLYDTYGFPIDLTADIARERELALDIDGFETAMAKQREQSQAASKFALDYNDGLAITDKTDFAGYESLSSEALVTTIIKGNQCVQTLEAGEQGVIILDRTPFYAESGGQVGDTGELQNKDAMFQVLDTQKNNSAHLHHGRVCKGSISIGDRLSSQVHAARRQAIKLNHTATHLLHAALIQILGDQVHQKGSLVEAERLRLDFTYSQAMSGEQLQAVEVLVNDMIRANVAGKIEIMDIEAAKASGAQALFGEKYGAKVRVLTYGEFSKELCGGTHVERTGDIGLFKITSEASAAAGIRRIEAVTGDYALAYVHDADVQISNLSQALKTPRDTVQGKTLQLMTRIRELEKQMEQLKAQLHSNAGNELVEQAQDIYGVKVLLATLDNIDVKSLRDVSKQLGDKLGDSVVAVAVINDDKVSVICRVSDSLVNRIKAGELVNLMAAEVGGKGGGKADMAQAGGNQPQNIDKAFAVAKQFLMKQLA
jgi:alanyl-tRNA synthetase